MARVTIEHVLAKAAQAIDQKLGGKPMCCPMCGGIEHTVLDGLVVWGVSKTVGSQVTTIAPTVAYQCNGCAYIMSWGLIGLGLFDLWVQWQQDETQRQHLLIPGGRWMN